MGQKPRCTIYVVVCRESLSNYGCFMRWSQSAGGVWQKRPLSSSSSRSIRLLVPFDSVEGKKPLWQAIRAAWHTRRHHIQLQTFIVPPSPSSSKHGSSRAGASGLVKNTTDVWPTSIFMEKAWGKNWYELRKSSRSKLATDASSAERGGHSKTTTTRAAARR